MKWWLPITILVTVGVVTGVIVYVAQNRPSSLSPPVNQPTTITQNPMVKVTANVSLQPESTSVRMGTETNYLFNVEAPDSQIVGIEAHLQFNPSVISVVSIEPTDLLNRPQEIAKTIDNQTGKILYAIGTLTPTVGKGTVFKIKVNILGQNPPASITFDRRTTKVALFSGDGKTRYTEANTTLNFVENPLSILP